jgi:hypothetical protein
VLATVTSVLAYLLHTIGAVEGLPSALLWHWRGQWGSLEAYTSFAYYAAVFGIIFGIFALLLWRIWPRLTDLDAFLACLIAFSAVNIGCDFVMRRPLYQVSGDPDARTLFFLAGLAGTEQALLSFSLVFVAGFYAAWHHKRTSADIPLERGPS